MCEAAPWTMRCTSVFVRLQPPGNTKNNNNDKQQQPCDCGSSLRCRLRAQQSTNTHSTCSSTIYRGRSPVAGTSSQIQHNGQAQVATSKDPAHTTGARLGVASQRLPRTSRRWPTHTQPVRKQAFRENCSDLPRCQVPMHSLWQAYAQKQHNAQLPATPACF